MARIAPLLLALLFLGCGEASLSGLDEPLRVQDGAFMSGALPGVSPKNTASDDKATPHVTAITSLPAVASPSLERAPLSGRTSGDAYSIGVRFAKLGTGYWVVPVGLPDVQNQGELTFSTSVDFGAEIAPGHHTLQLVAFDAQGRAGLQRSQTICVLRPFDDNLNACDSTTEPPSHVLSLSWDTDMDLDLTLRTPSGKLVSAKQPSTAERTLDAGVALDGSADAASVGRFDHDSNPNCLIDSRRRESVIWQGEPEPGLYSVYVNVFSACGKPAAHFVLSAYERIDGKTAGTFALAETSPAVHGEVLGDGANGGTQTGLFVTRVRFP